MLDEVVKRYGEAVYGTNRNLALEAVRDAVVQGVLPEDIVFKAVLPCLEKTVEAVSENGSANLARHFMASRIAGTVDDAWADNVVAALRAAFVEQQERIIKREVDRIIERVDFARSQIVPEADTLVKEHVCEAYAMLENSQQRNAATPPPEEIKQTIIDALQPMRVHHGKGDFFVLDLDGGIVFGALAEHRGIRFQYADTYPPAAEKMAWELNADRLFALPRELTDELSRAAELLDGPRILDAIDHIGDMDHELGERLRRRAENQQYRELLRAFDSVAEKRA